MRTNIEGIARETVPNIDSPSANIGLAVLVPFVGIGISEWFVFTGQIDAALWIHLLTFIYCTSGPLVLASETHVLRALALVPLFRLVNLGIPVFFELTLLWLPLVYGPFLIGLFLLSKQHSSVTVSLRDFIELVFLSPVATVLALLLASLEYAIIQPPALIPTWDVVNVMVLAVVMLGFVGLVEEFLFRGILQRTLINRIGTVPGVGLTAVIFGLMHSAYGQTSEIGFAILFGLVVGVIYNRTSNLVIVTYIHGLLNIVLFGLYPIHGSFSPF